ncbi:hypothetical protein DsansV1_C04g0037151 [Dioscorea sansibarensis]
MKVFHHCQASLMENFSKLISQVQSLVHVLLQQHLGDQHDILCHNEGLKHLMLTMIK